MFFAFHGYPWLIHRLTYRRTNHDNYPRARLKEEGTTTTPFDMVVRNDIDRFHLVMDVIDRVPSSATVPLTCGKRCATSSLSTPITSSGGAKTCRKSATGYGRIAGTRVTILEATRLGA